MSTDKQIVDLEYFDEFDNHEYVSLFYYKDVGLKGIVAIHDTSLGPATGGTRMWPYSGLDVAIKDALNLSKAMTYKCAMAGVKFGGGKAVIMGDPKNKTVKLLERYGAVIDSWKGKFTTGTDVGISHEDTIIMSRKSKYILGQHISGIVKQDTSKMAALGVYTGIMEILKSMYDNINLPNRTIAIKGVGKLGSELLRLLYEKNVKMYYSDIDNQKTNLIKEKFPNATLVSPEKIHMVDADVYSPCALGNEFTEKNINFIKAKAIVGGANNQIPSLEIGDQLFNKGIIYAPDYVVNAGGLINIVDELEEDGYKYERVKYRINNIKNTLQKIIQQSEKEKISTHRMADNLAKNIIKR